MSKKGRRPDSFRSPYSSHPGYDQNYQAQYSSCAPRVKSAGESNYVRGRGSMALYLEQSHPRNEGYQSARPLPKARTDLAANILNKSISGSVGSVLGGPPSCYQDADPNYKQRVYGPAVGIAEQHRGQMSCVIGSGASFCPAPAQSRMPVPRIKSSALNTAEMSRGSAVNLLFHEYGKLGPDPRPPPRVRHQAEDNARKAVGNVGKLFHGELQASSRPQPRIRGVGEGNMDKQKGSLQHLMKNAGYEPKGYSHYKSSGDISGRSTSRL